MQRCRFVHLIEVGIRSLYFVDRGKMCKPNTKNLQPAQQYIAPCVKLVFSG